MKVGGVRLWTVAAAATLLSQVATAAAIAFSCSAPTGPFYDINTPSSSLTPRAYPGITSGSFSCPGFTPGTGQAVESAAFEFFLGFELGGSVLTNVNGVFTPQLGSSLTPVILNATGTGSGFFGAISQFLFQPATAGVTSFGVSVDTQITGGGLQPCFVGGPPECGAILVGGRVIYSFSDVGFSSSNPIQPSGGTNGNWTFIGGGSGMWYDPPLTSGYDYTGISGTTFTKITLPGCCGSVNVSYGPGFGNSLGSFAPNSTIDFQSLTGAAVGAFRIWGLNPEVDAANPNAFPLQIFFSSSTGSFTQVALPSEEVPEPSAFALGAIGVSMVAGWRKRKAKQS